MKNHQLTPSLITSAANMVYELAEKAPATDQKLLSILAQSGCHQPVMIRWDDGGGVWEETVRRGVLMQHPLNQACEDIGATHLTSNFIVTRDARTGEAHIDVAIGHKSPDKGPVTELPSHQLIVALNRLRQELFSTKTKDSVPAHWVKMESKPGQAAIYQWQAASGRAQNLQCIAMELAVVQGFPHRTDKLPSGEMVLSIKTDYLESLASREAAATLKQAQA